MIQGNVPLRRGDLSVTQTMEDSLQPGAVLNRPAGEYPPQVVEAELPAVYRCKTHPQDRPVKSLPDGV